MSGSTDVWCNYCGAWKSLALECGYSLSDGWVAIQKEESREHLCRKCWMACRSALEKVVPCPRPHEWWRRDNKEIMIPTTSKSKIARDFLEKLCGSNRYKTNTLLVQIYDLLETSGLLPKNTMESKMS